MPLLTPRCSPATAASANTPASSSTTAPREGDLDRMHYEGFLARCTASKPPWAEKTDAPFRFTVITMMPGPTPVLHESRLGVMELTSVSKDGLLRKQRIKEVEQ
jgi:hypothetical protein